MGDIIIKKSTIHGTGVFANRDFKKGEVVIQYNLKPLTEEEFNNLSEKEKHYTSREGGHYLLFLPPARFVNHSCDANTNPKNKCDIAIKDIKKGEEVTTDYAKDNIPNLNMKCNCGSKNCKVVIKN